MIQKTWFYKAFNNTFFFTSCKVIMVLVLLTFVLSGEALTAEKAFLTLALFNVVRLSLTLFFPLAIQLVSEALISVKRIQQFLELEELGESHWYYFSGFHICFNYPLVYFQIRLHLQMSLQKSMNQVLDMSS